MKIRIALLFVFLFSVSHYVEALNTNNNNVVNQNQKEKDINSRYSIVVGSFSSLTGAKRFGEKLSSKGYDVSYRNNVEGLIRVCISMFDNNITAHKYLKELKKKDNRFKDAWVLTIDNEDVAPVAEKPISKQESVTSQKPKDVKVSGDETLPAINTPKGEEEKRDFCFYCIAIREFFKLDEATAYGKNLQAQGYDVFIRKAKKDDFLVCMYEMRSRSDAEKRLDKMKHIDPLFANAWISGYDSLK